MKTFTIRCSISLVFLCHTTCINYYESQKCQIISYYWEDEWHKAEYNSADRLTALIAPNSTIKFDYDDSHRLTAANIYFNGEADPFYIYEFVQGPEGIIQTDTYAPSGTTHWRSFYHYSSPNTVDYIIYQDINNGEIGFQIRDDITYSNGNVKHIHGTSPEIFTDYYGNSYDGQENPFRLLAEAVGNPAFFPIGVFANFPMTGNSTSVYDISALSRFSKNNPLRAEYRIPGTYPSDQYFTYVYDGSLPTYIKWDDVSTGVPTSTSTYAFKFKCKTSTIHE